jgi:hypothetical protein
MQIIKKAFTVFGFMFGGFLFGCITGDFQIACVAPIATGFAGYLMD